MHLNIKNDEAHELAKELAALTGESMTEAVLVALRERLTRELNTPERIEERANAIMAIGREVAARMSPETRTMDVDAYLYDPDTGLPR